MNISSMIVLFCSVMEIVFFTSTEAGAIRFPKNKILLLFGQQQFASLFVIYLKMVNF